MPLYNGLARKEISKMRHFFLVCSLVVCMGATDVVSEQEFPSVYVATMEAKGLDVPKCRFRISYPKGPFMTKFSLSEQSGRWFWATVSTLDPAMFNTRIHLEVDDWDVIDVGVGSQIEGNNFAGGLVARSSQDGWALMRTLLLASKEAKSVRLVTTRKTIELPIQGFREAMIGYDNCRHTRLL